MRKKTLLPKPESVFLKVRCSKCGNEQILFDRSSNPVECNICKDVLSVPTGGKSDIKAEIVQVLD